MLKRLTAIIFIFVIAGQVSAGVCGCLKGESQTQHSCCRHKKTGADSMRPRSCCKEDCVARQMEKVPQDRTGTSGRITPQAVAESGTPKIAYFASVAFRRPALVRPTDDHRLKYSRPPDLYLRHHAFLI